MNKRLLAFVGGILLAASAVHAAPAAQQEPLELGKAAATRFTLQRDGAPDIRYVISQPAHKAPLVLFVQGSGCTPPFVGLGTPNRYSTVFNFVPLAQRGDYAVMVVDKPYQPDAPPQAPPGVATGCPAAFNANFSYDTWLDTLRGALRHALALPWVDGSRVLVFGVSEGAVMAAGLARALPEVTHVALIGGTGTSQLFDFAANAYRAGTNDDDTLARLRDIDATVDAINADPRSSVKFAWGHTYLRWSSFFAQAPGENLVQSKARVWLASGMRDDSVPVLSTEVAYALLRALGRDVTFRRLPRAGHNLMAEGGSMADVQKEYDAIMAWFDRR
ncbi:prolyl oligopeptidase family serine peptidase [Massilia sp. Root1485]|uniref:alpha/beta hydrolase family protein n=1 Tax=Massilia sp. Root1485 TaxID=1736472 RepID=UPI001E4D6BD1|nr:prolyl oligopeptidase family serine peptidase [Massilia sp. Root1485]